MKRIAWAAVVLAAAGTAAAGPVPGLPGSAQDELSGDLRGLLLKNLPNPLYETSRNWGHQAQVKRLLFDEKRAQIFEKFMGGLKAQAKVTVHSELLKD